MNDRQKQNQFVDTNIILYAYDCSEPVKQNKARALLHSLWDTGLGCISIQVLQELYVNLTRKIPNSLSSVKARQIVLDLGRWRYHAPRLEDLVQAIDIQQRYLLSFWDAMVVCSAKSLQCAILWTEDLNSGQDYDGVQAINPFISP